MKQAETSDKSDEVIICTDDTGMQLFLSEKAANRLAWILTGFFVLLSLPLTIKANGESNTIELIGRDIYRKGNDSASGIRS